MDIYSDGTFFAQNNVVQDNVFANPVTAAIDFEGGESGQVIARNVVE